YFIEDLRCDVIIGINDCEREEKQPVLLSMSLSDEQFNALDSSSLDFRDFSKRLYDALSRSSYHTLESLASSMALQGLLSVGHFKAPVITLSASKPVAIVLAQSSEVAIVRRRSDFPDEFKVAQDASSENGLHTAAIALGSNMGDSFQSIEAALCLLESPAPVISADTNVITNVVDTSFLYETAPMYVVDQPSFINGACIVETNLPPMDLLRLLKEIERHVGRVPSIRNGPRAVDLDIVFYDDKVLDTRTSKASGDENLDGHLVIPHPRLAERQFVLQPLNDMIPNYVHPVLHKRIRDLLATLQPTTPNDEIINKVVPVPRLPSGDDVPATLTHWKWPRASTQIMATLNVTPDSFSGDIRYNSIPDAVAYAQDAVSHGATIIDVGGYSTRPGAAFVPQDEEIARVVPAIRDIRDAGIAVPISIDTFRPRVAEAAILAGANCINDVYAFTGTHDARAMEEGEPSGDQCTIEMKRVARKYSVPVILMHSRGEASANKDYSQYDYAGPNAAVLEGIRVELGAKVSAIVHGRGGVRRWSVIVDPGLGFSKTVKGNVDALRHASSLTTDTKIGRDGTLGKNPLTGYPILIGPSRKSFLGAILQRGEHGRLTEPSDRDWATAATVAHAVDQ
ncbi:Dihydropteroate synthase, partial [Fistulina hepatica ATCC 64428]